MRTTRAVEYPITPERLRLARKKSGMSVQMVADLIGVHRNTVIRWEAGADIPGPAQISLRWILREAIEAKEDAMTRSSVSLKEQTTRTA